MPAPMRPLVFVPLALILAGCTAPSTPGSAGAPDVAQDPPADATFWAGCDQWHLHFDARAEDFGPDTPPGYAVTTDETGLTTLLMHVTFCPDVQEAYVAVPVTAPSGHDDPDRSEIATIQIFHAGHGAELYPEPFHGRLVDATFDLSETPTGPSLTVTGGGETFRVANVLTPSSGVFSAERWARIAFDGGTYGILNADGNESTNVGFGPVTYTHQGPGGAPPATTGIAHIVTGLDIHMRADTRS